LINAYKACREIAGANDIDAVDEYGNRGERIDAACDEICTRILWLLDDIDGSGYLQALAWDVQRMPPPSATASASTPSQ
jgi:hypothetical protein